MNHFTQEQLQEVAQYLGVTPPETLPVRDGHVGKDDRVWWRCDGGPELIAVKDNWSAIREWPGRYQLVKPKTKVVYVD